MCLLDSPKLCLLDPSHPKLRLKSIGHSYWLEVVEEKKRTWGKQSWRVLAELLKSFLVKTTVLWSPWIKLYYFRLCSYVLLSKSYFLYQDFVKRLCGNTLIEVQPRLIAVTCMLEALDYSAKPLLMKSSMAKSTPPWFHFPLPCIPRPEGHVQAAGNTSHVGVNSTTTLYGIFFIEGSTLALT